ncbi:MAG: hypothetical protein ACHQIM_12745 [Sphingobacteriales bacterium]
MRNLSETGRIFYGIAIAGMGLLTAYYKDFPYMLIPPNHSGMPGFAMLAFIAGTLFILAGACIVFEKRPGQISLLLGTLLLLIFCFYHIPYQFMAISNYRHFGEWENAAKELALASGAFVIAGCFSKKNENTLFRVLRKLTPYGTIFFALTIISFGINHFLYAKDAAGYMPAWIPGHICWIYFAGAALLGAGIAIILKIKVGLFATLLGAMIFTWFISLHIPKVIAAPVADRASEITSAFLALAYSGIAFVIAGAGKKVA